MSDYEFLAIKEFDGKLIHLVSSEFTGNAAQISYTVPSGKTFYHLKSKLYPVVDTVKNGKGAVNTVTLSNRRVDLEIQIQSDAAKDVLTHDMESAQGSASVTNVAQGQGNAAVTGQYESNIVESFDGDGSKVFTLTSTNTSGTYRVSMIGIIETTGDSPALS